jgi:hypothetical protein
MDTGKDSVMALKIEERSAHQDPVSASHRAPFSWPRLIEKLLAAFRSEAPVGYEDETGFHFGVRPQ